MAEQVLTEAASDGAATQGGATLVAVSDAVQTITESGSPTGGSFELTWPGYPSASVPRDADAIALQALLDTTFGADNTVVTGGPLPGSALVVTFAGALAGVTVPLPVIDDTLLTAISGTPHAHVVVTEPGGGDVTLAPANASRDKLVISADVADAWLSLGVAAAVVGQGVRVKAGGPPYEVTGWKGEVRVVSTGAAHVSVTETSFASGDDQGEKPTGADTFTPSGPSDDYFERAVPTGPALGTPYPPQGT